MEQFKLYENGFVFDKWQSVQFTFYNTTNTTVTLNIFGGDSLTLINETQTSPNDFWIEGSTSYNQFIKDLLFDPKVVRQIKIVSDENSYLYQPLNVLSRDANGNRLVLPKLPNTQISTNQYQANIVYVDLLNGDLILNNNMLINEYRFPSNTSVTMVFYYNDIDRIDFITGGDKLISETCEFLAEPEFNDEQLEFMKGPYTIHKFLKFWTKKVK